jgi:RNA polymerase sigma-54 factor
VKPGLQFKISQSLALTPQLQQSIKLLQLSTAELEQEIEQMLLENPMLEAGEEEADATQSVEDDARSADAAGDAADAVDIAPTLSATHATLDEFAHTELTTSSESLSETASELSQPDWQAETADGRLDDNGEWSFDDAPSAAARNASGDGDEFDAGSHTAPASTLSEYLRNQLSCCRLSHEDRAFAEFIIDSLNDDGWLVDSLESLAQSLGADGMELSEQEDLLSQLTTALKLVQSFDPPGVGARTLPECLCLQLQASLQGRPCSPLRRIAERLCSHHLDGLAKRDYKRLAKSLDVDEEDIRAAHGIIAQLNPRPAASFAGESVREVVPDVFVQRVGNGAMARYKASLNPDVLPKLRVNQLYAGIIKQQRGSGEGLQQQLQEARWFIKNIQQRFDTILRVSQAIIDRQRNFFMLGAAGMRPLVLKEIADSLGLHESTISRVTTAKYMHTPFGTYELKYFFSSGVSTDTGGSASSTAVKSLIRDMVSAEDRSRPLSDNEIVDKLGEQGIVIARRTVAKYRDALRIAPANLRKA